MAIACHVTFMPCRRENRAIRQLQVLSIDTSADQIDDDDRGTSLILSWPIVRLVRTKCRDMTAISTVDTFFSPHLLRRRSVSFQCNHAWLVRMRLQLYEYVVVEVVVYSQHWQFIGKWFWLAQNEMRRLIFRTVSNRWRTECWLFWQNNNICRNNSIFTHAFLFVQWRSRLISSGIHRCWPWRVAYSMWMWRVYILIIIDQKNRLYSSNSLQRICGVLKLNDRGPKECRTEMTTMAREIAINVLRWAVPCCRAVHSSVIAWSISGISSYARTPHAYSWVVRTS